MSGSCFRMLAVICFRFLSFLIFLLFFFLFFFKILKQFQVCENTEYLAERRGCDAGYLGDVGNTTTKNTLSVQVGSLCSNSGCNFLTEDAATTLVCLCICFYCACWRKTTTTTKNKQTHNCITFNSMVQNKRQNLHYV